MIIFPVLNFVLPLILTSFLLVNSQECVKCRMDRELLTKTSFENEKFEEKKGDNEKNKIKAKGILFEKKQSNVY